MHPMLAGNHTRKECVHLPMINSATQNVVSQGTSAIELRDVTKRFLTPKGQAYTALRDLNLSVAPGEFCAVVGPTGCGKSTTLGLISGLERPSVGEVEVMGNPVQGIDPRIGSVFQADAVFPWKNAMSLRVRCSVASPKPKRSSLLTIGSRVLDFLVLRITFRINSQEACANAWH